MAEENNANHEASPWSNLTEEEPMEEIKEEKKDIVLKVQDVIHETNLIIGTEEENGKDSPR